MTITSGTGKKEGGKPGRCGIVRKKKEEALEKRKSNGGFPSKGRKKGGGEASKALTN